MKHALADGLYARRRQDCAEAARLLGVASLRDATLEMVETAGKIANETVRRRARHVMTENLRTLAASHHLGAGEYAELGQLMYESHWSLRDDFQVSSVELDTLVDIARSIGPSGGVLGARMTGGGFGGCIVALVRSAQVEAVDAPAGPRIRGAHRQHLDHVCVPPGPGCCPGQRGRRSHDPVRGNFRATTGPPRTVSEKKKRAQLDRWRRTSIASALINKLSLFKN